MKILLTNWDLRKIGGSQLWTYTMYKALKRLGHEVLVFSPRTGGFSDVFPKITGGRPNVDLLIANQSIGLDLNCFKISNCHSFFVPIEKFRPGADAYVSVSNEVKDSQEIDSKVILNPVDTTIYKPTRKVTKIKKVLYLNHDGGGAYNEIAKACKSLSLELKTIDNKPDLSEQMNEADLVIGWGRGLIEAMLCERPIISLDQRSWTDEIKGYGIVNSKNYHKAQYDNYSGRLKGFHYNSKDIVDLIMDVDVKDAPNVRELAYNDHDYIIITRKYEKLLN